MGEERFFTEDELMEMGKRTRDLIDEAIDEGNLEKAKRLNHRMYAEFLSMHDFFRDWITGLLTYIFNNFGKEDLEESLRESMAARFRDMVDTYGEVDFRKKVEMLAMGLRGHLQPMEVTEDEEKVCIKMLPCGTGERLINEGAYGPPKNFGVLAEPMNVTYGRRDCPIYCSHEPVLEMLPIEWEGYPLWVVYPEKDKWGGCRFCIYKKPEYIPVEVFKRIGKKKPGSS